ncbi:hypothetical protein Ocin01_17094 [Orchesella cincta]|uniref:Uncharacterized protein n=1 Tax=Orchesella cincta TaxID=48709 RepID=A0A1D2M9C5_ORCCI|nr:hypothetical protein Ocin01_17094 [Orchesella cincta]
MHHFLKICLVYSVFQAVMTDSSFSNEKPESHSIRKRDLYAVPSSKYNGPASSNYQVAYQPQNTYTGGSNYPSKGKYRSKSSYNQNPSSRLGTKSRKRYQNV